MTKLDATGSGLVFSTYLGGSDNDSSASEHRRGWRGQRLRDGPDALDRVPDDRRGRPDDPRRRHTDAFVTKLNATGSGLVYSTYLGGSGSEFVCGIAVDGAGSAYVTGGTTSTDFPTTAGAAQTTNAGVFDAFVTKLDATGSGLVYSTYLGGSGSDPISAVGIAVDGAGSAYVTGRHGLFRLPDDRRGRPADPRRLCTTPL